MKEYFNLSFGSCGSHCRPLSAAHYITNVLKSKAYFNIGDQPYVNSSQTAFGLTPPAAGQNATLQTFKDIYAQRDANPGHAMMQAAMDYYHIPGDHEWAGNDWDHTISKAGGGTWTQTQVNTHFKNGKDCIAWENPGTPAAGQNGNNAKGVGLTNVATIPSVVTNGSFTASAYIPMSFYVGYDKTGSVNNTTPYIEFYCMDDVTCRSDHLATDNSSKKHWGADQLNKLVARLSMTTAKFKVIVSASNIANGGNWATYMNEYNLIMAQLTPNAQLSWNNPGGLVIISGDAHACFCVNDFVYTNIWDIITSAFCGSNTSGGMWNWDGITYPLGSATTATYGPPPHPAANSGGIVSPLPGATIPGGQPGFVSLHVYEGKIGIFIRNVNSGSPIFSLYWKEDDHQPLTGLI